MVVSFNKGGLGENHLPTVTFLMRHNAQTSKILKDSWTPSATWFLAHGCSQEASAIKPDPTVLQRGIDDMKCMS